MVGHISKTRTAKLVHEADPSISWVVEGGISKSANLTTLVLVIASTNPSELTILWRVNCDL